MGQEDNEEDCKQTNQHTQSQNRLHHILYEPYDIFHQSKAK